MITFHSLYCEFDKLYFIWVFNVVLISVSVNIYACNSAMPVEEQRYPTHRNKTLNSLLSFWSYLDTLKA